MIQKKCLKELWINHNFFYYVKFNYIKKTILIKIAFLSGAFYRPRQINNISNDISFLCKESISNKTSNVNEKILEKS